MLRAGIRIAISRAIIAITTRSSTSVNADLFIGMVPFSSEGHRFCRRASAWRPLDYCKDIPSL
jgi:hypothetical protein